MHIPGILSSASPWQNDCNSNLQTTSKKRIPSMCIPRNKTVKNNSKTINNEPIHDIYDVDNEDNTYTKQEPFQTEMSINQNQNQNQNTIESIQQNNENRLTRVQQLINNMNIEDDGQSLANFKPMDYSNNTTSASSAPIKPLYSSSSFNNNNSNTNSDIKSNPYSSYNDVYLGDSKIGSVPYYKNNYNNSKPTDNGLSERIMEKLSRMMHILEEQQLEPTKHITEEFILYTFLGIFVIYIVDSFTRAGKYIR
jgi:hypothetical protein